MITWITSAQTKPEKLILVTLHQVCFAEGTDSWVFRQSDSSHTCNESDIGEFYNKSTLSNIEMPYRWQKYGAFERVRSSSELGRFKSISCGTSFTYRISNSSRDGEACFSVLKIGRCCLSLHLILQLIDRHSCRNDCVFRAYTVNEFQISLISVDKHNKHIVSKIIVLMIIIHVSLW